ncbi:MAG TPA: hypothetical protein PK323_11680 [Bacteroidia bacterium]|nr:hypothetical protein [Bacteroidia bacterium]
MLNKPIQIKKIAMIMMALVFWISGVSLFAQNKQANNTDLPKKQVATEKPKVSLSNQDPNAKKVDDATARKIAQEEKLKQDRAAEAKRQNSAKEVAATPVKTSKSSVSTSSKAPAVTMQKTSTNQASSTNQAAKSQDIQKDWEIKKAKLTADMKAKGVPQEDIDKKIASLEKNMNLNNNSTK